MLLLSTYCALLCYKVSKKSLAQGRSGGIRCRRFGPNWTKIINLPLKGIFFEKLTDANFAQFMYLSKYYNLQKKIIKMDHKIQGSMHRFLTNCSRVLFFGKLTIVTFVNLLFPIKFKLKNPYRESEHAKFCNFGLNWDQIAGFSLLGQRIRRSPALAKNLLILSHNIRKKLPFSRLPQQMFILLQ